MLGTGDLEGSLTFLSDETFTTSRQTDHYHGNARVFDLNALAISLGTETRHAVQVVWVSFRDGRHRYVRDV